MEQQYKKIWHSGEEKPQIYKDKITGRKLTTYCICVEWYDYWNECLCEVAEDGNFREVSNNKIYEPDCFGYWCYVYDIYPVETNEKYLVDISVQEGH